jgi:hypothetical protein
MTLGDDEGMARKINVFRLNPIHLTSCSNVNKWVIWELFVGWGRVYLTCLLRFRDAGEPAPTGLLRMMQYLRFTVVMRSIGSSNKGNSLLFC